MTSFPNLQNLKIIVPVRLNSSRLPGKALIPRNGKAHIICLLDSLASWFPKENIFVATDSKLIAHFVSKSGFNYLTTDSARNGTERIAMACQKLELPDDQWIINIQGDLTEMPKNIGLKIISSVHETISMGTASWMTFVHSEPWDNVSLENNSGSVWAKFDYHEQRIYDFGRGAFNSNKVLPKYKFCSHVGLYAYSVKALETILNLPESKREIALSLEQMRFIDNNMYPTLSFLDEVPSEINSEEDFIEIELK